MEGPAEEQGITYQDLLCYFETHGDAAEMRRENCDQEEGGVCSRWKPFEAFRREVQGEEVMTSTDDGILRDYLPGTYPMAEIVQFTDLPDLLPARASVQGARLVYFLSNLGANQTKALFLGGRREARAPLLDSSFQLALMVKSRRRCEACYQLDEQQLGVQFSILISLHRFRLPAQRRLATMEQELQRAVNRRM